MDCSVCFDSTRTFPEYPVASCSHGADVCNDCHRNFLRTSTALVTNATTGEIQFACMTRGCTLSGGYSTDALFRLFTDRSARDALFERLAHACFERMSNAVYCTRPQCAALLTYEVSADAPVCTSIVCRRCANAICLTCKRDAHDGVSCADYEESHTSAGWTSEKLINAISRRCPQCTFRIFRQGGCPHMTCSRCAYQFCYGCLGDRATYRAGAHEGCDRIATQFELDGMRILVEVRNAERAARRQARIDEQAARRAARRAERDARVAAGVDSDDKDDGFDAFAAFANLEEEMIQQQQQQAVEDNRFNAFAAFEQLGEQQQQQQQQQQAVENDGFDAFVAFANLEEPTAVQPFDAFASLRTQARRAMSLVRSLVLPTWMTFEPAPVAPSLEQPLPDELLPMPSRAPTRRPLSMSA